MLHREQTKALTDYRIRCFFILLIQSASTCCLFKLIANNTLCASTVDSIRKKIADIQRFVSSYIENSFPSGTEHAGVPRGMLHRKQTKALTGYRIRSFLIRLIQSISKCFLDKLIANRSLCASSVDSIRKRIADIQRFVSRYIEKELPDSISYAPSENRRSVNRYRLFCTHKTNRHWFQHREQP